MGDGSNGIAGQIYRVHEFTSTGSSSFNVESAPVGVTVEYLVVAGGGGSGYGGEAEDKTMLEQEDQE